MYFFVFFSYTMMQLNVILRMCHRLLDILF